MGSFWWELRFKGSRLHHEVGWRQLAGRTSHRAERALLQGHGRGERDDHLVPGGDRDGLHHAQVRGDAAGEEQVHVLKDKRQKKRKILLHTFGLHGGYLGRRTTKCERSVLESEGKIRRTIATIWSDFNPVDMTYMWPDPQPDPEGPGEHFYVVVDFLHLADPMHRGLIPVLCDVKGWLEGERAVGRIEATLLLEWSRWHTVIDAFAIDHECTRRSGNQCIMKIGGRLVLDDEPFLVPDSTLISINYDLPEEGPEHVSLMQRSASSTVAQAYQQVVQRRTEQHGEEIDEASYTVHLLHRKKDYVKANIQPMNPFEERRDIAGIWGVEVDEIQGIHPVRSRPEDFPADGSQLLITRWKRDDDYKVYELDVQALFDVEVHSGLTDASTPKLFRHVDWCRRYMTRQDFLYKLWVYDFCRIRVDDRCLLWINNILWPIQDGGYRLINHGDYIRVAVPARDGENVESTWRLLQATEDRARDHVMYESTEGSEASFEEEESDTTYGPPASVSEPEPRDELDVFEFSTDVLEVHIHRIGAEGKFEAEETINAPLEFIYNPGFLGRQSPFCQGELKDYVVSPCCGDKYRWIASKRSNSKPAVLCKIHITTGDCHGIHWIPALVIASTETSTTIGSDHLMLFLGQQSPLVIEDATPYQAGNIVEIHHAFPNHEDAFLQVDRPLALVPEGTSGDAEGDFVTPRRPMQIRLEETLHGSDYNPLGHHPDLKMANESCLDFRAVFSLWQWLDAALPVVSWSLPQGIEWHSSTLAWIDDWWDLQTAEEIYVYTDGSAHASHHTSAASAVFFVRTGYHWSYAGYLRQDLPGPPCPHRAELHGLLLGLHWICNTLHRLAFTQDRMPQINFAFDATSAGYKAFGQWGGGSYPTLVGHIRALCYFVEFRYGIQLNYEHVFGHTSDPGNEAANTVAHFAQGQQVSIASVWSQYFDRAECPEAQWLWAIWKPEWKQFWKNGRLYLPERPVTNPVLETFIPPKTAEFEQGPPAEQLGCTIATANVLTLLPGGQDHGLQGRTRMDLLQDQFHEHGCQIVGLQETRQRKECKVSQRHYYVFSSPATSKGHYGIQIWISKTLRLGPTDSKFEPQHFKVISKDPRWLVLKVLAPFFRAILVCAHAPTSQNDPEVLGKWWDDLWHQTPQKYKKWPHFLMIDANSRVGSEVSECVGGHHPDHQDAGGDHLHDYLCEADVWLPSTFDTCHSGTSGTWLHPRTELWCRGDYIGIPRSWDLDVCRSYPPDDIDLSLTKEDHRAVCVHFEWTTTKRHPTAVHVVRPHYDLDLLRERLQGDQRVQETHDLIGAIGTTSWGIDVHTHTHYLQTNLSSWLNKRYLQKKQAPKRQMSDEVWELVKAKKSTRSFLYAHQLLLRRRLLQGCFNGWAKKDGELCWETVEEARETALKLQTFRRLGRLVTAALRREDKQFYDRLAQEAGEMDAPGRSKQFWARIRGAFPKFKNKSRANPLALDILDSQWIPHFARLEAGEEMTQAELFQRCIGREHDGGAKGGCSLEELPTRLAVEQTLRALQPGKAPGPDGIPSDVYRHAASSIAGVTHDLYCKAVWWAQEPLQSKGGIMFPLHKQGSALEASNYRGIMMVNVLAKAYHKWLRQQVIGRLDSLRLDTMIGGFKGQQAVFGAHCVQTIARLAHLGNRPFACLFVDVQGAYHFLVRELVVGAGDPEDIQQVLRNLERWDADISGLQQWLQAPGLLERLKFPSQLTKVLREVHQDTWARMPHLSQVIRTNRGSRPGSPLADVIYAVLMFDVHLEVQRTIEEDGAISAGYEALEVAPFALTWADDLAIPLAFEHNEAVIPGVKSILAATHRAFEKRGLLLNMNKGKTSAVLAYRGAKAPAYRKANLLVENPGTWVELTNGRWTWLNFCTTYRHLGALFTGDGELPHEIRSRMGQARAAFVSMKRSLFGNRYIQVRTRLKLFEALIISRLCYGLATWGHIPPRAYGAVEAFITKCQRYICGYGYDGGPSNDEMQSTFRLANLGQRLAVARISYATKVWSVGPSTLQTLLLKEADQTDTSWWHYLQADLQWCKDLLGEDFPTPNLDAEALARTWKLSPAVWTRSAKRAFRLGVLQEAAAADARYWHRRILRIMTSHGATTTGFADPAVMTSTYDCTCGKVFTTPQGLAAHRRLIHGYIAPEALLADGLQHCPACLKYLWSSARVKQHLSYIPRRGGPNRCYQKLLREGIQPALQGCQPEDSEMRGTRGINRRDALQTYGPMPLPRNEKATQYEQATTLLMAKRAQYHEKYDIDNVGRAACERLWAQMDAATRWWFTTWDYDQEEEEAKSRLQDTWLTLDFEAAVQSAIALPWGRQSLPEITAEWETGVAERLAEEAYADLVIPSDVYEAEQEIDKLAGRVHRLYKDLLRQQDDDQPHRAVRLGPVQTRGGHKKVRPHFQRYMDHDNWNVRWKEVQLVNGIKDMEMPIYRTVHHKPILLVLHLFAGRRRQEDYHAFLAELSRDAPYQVHILSLDTAIDQVHGNLSSTSKTWSEIMGLLEEGRVAAGLAGSPCETFSSARYWVPPPDEGADDPSNAVKRWPRPLRDGDRPWGLPGLTSRELRQLFQGSQFAMQTLAAMTWTLMTGGCFASEHPYPPREEWKVSVFRTPLARLLLQFPEVDLRCYNQGNWGACSTKPTGLMTVRMPSMHSSMWKRCHPTPLHKRTTAIGKNSQGQFKTTALKEYPRAFSFGLAQATNDVLRQRWRRGDFRTAPTLDERTRMWIDHLLQLSSIIKDEAVMKPDYQPNTG